MALQVLLAQRGVATSAQLQHVLERQAKYGGDFITNLYETMDVDEHALVHVLAEETGLRAAPAGALPIGDRAVLERVATDTAARFLCVPLEIQGPKLVLAVAQPLRPEHIAAIAMASGLEPLQRIAPAVRVQEALANGYGIPVPPRTEALLEVFAGVRPRALLDPPKPDPNPPASLPRRVSIGEPFSVGAAHATQRARRRVGPIDLETAYGEIEKATDRDAILDVFFQFGKQFFAYTILFVVVGDLAQGRDAFGDGAPADRVTGIKIPMPGPSLLSKARAVGGPIQAKPASDGLDQLLFAQIDRVPSGPVLVVPVVVRKRAVALLLGDAGAGSVLREAQVKEVNALAEAAAQAFERLILQKKQLGGEPSAPSRRADWARASEAIAAVASSRRAASTPPPPLPFAPLDTDEPITKPRPLPWKRALLVAAALAVGGAIVMVATSEPKHENTVVVAARDLPGAPHAIDPLSLIGTAKEQAAPKGNLAVFRADTNSKGEVNLSDAPLNTDESPIRYAFSEGERPIEVRVDAEGMHVVRVEPQPLVANACDGAPCADSVPPPHCSLKDVWAEARAGGALETDRATITYGAKRGGSASWWLSVPLRGKLEIADSTCKRAARAKLMPPERPLSSLPVQPRAVDPVALVDIARTQSGLEADAVLTEIDAWFVARTGRVDLYGPKEGHIAYTFTDPPSAGAQPRRRRVTVNRSGIPLVAPLSAYEEATLATAPVPSPQCTFQNVWDKLEASPPPDSFARITYAAAPNSNPPRGEWTIQVSDTVIKEHVMDARCGVRK